MAYLNWDTKKITDFSGENIAQMYDAGYVLTRVDKGLMNKSRSFRIKLSDFEMSSENRRIARKSEHLSMTACPLPFIEYTWEIGKLAKDFYAAHEAVFTPNKIKEILTDAEKSNFNTLLIYSDNITNMAVGYVICYADTKILHYSYPFYVTDTNEPSRGLGMMMQAIEHAHTKGLAYIYLGSLQRPSDTYKLQFKGGEWFDGEKWQTDIAPLKDILK
jgi:arginyl-tRNA--protein-N-Asp/Glu arginylyltransferase